MASKDFLIKNGLKVREGIEADSVSASVITSGGETVLRVPDVDSAFVAPFARAAISAGANIFYNEATGEISAGPSTDSAQVIAVINNEVDKAFVDALLVDAGTLGGAAGTSYLRSDVADTKSAGDLNFADNVKATFGDSNDLQVYHDGTNSYISEQGTGTLKALTNTLEIKNAGDTSTMLKTEVGGAVTQYFAGVQKTATTDSGLDVTGGVAVETDGRLAKVTLRSNLGNGHNEAGGAVDFIATHYDSANTDVNTLRVQGDNNSAGLMHMHFTRINTSGDEKGHFYAWDENGGHRWSTTDSGGAPTTELQATLSKSGLLTLHNNGATLNGALNMGSNRVNFVAEPISPGDAATKAYVDANSSGLQIHPAVQVATVSDLSTLVGIGTVTYDSGIDGVGSHFDFTGALDSIDGYTLTTNDRILVKNQTKTFTKGVYVFDSATRITRATDFDNPSEIVGGDFIFIQNGLENGNHGYVQTEAVDSIGKDAMSFTQYSGTADITVGAGLEKIGTLITLADDGITLSKLDTTTVTLAALVAETSETTTNLPEGANLYYTQARFDAALNASNAVQTGDHATLGDTTLNSLTVRDSGVVSKIEIGEGRTADGKSIVDLVTSATGGSYTDYGLRIKRDSGDDGTAVILQRGLGGLEVDTQDGANVVVKTGGTETFTVNNADKTITLDQYGSGTKTGTTANHLGVTSAGKVIEVPESELVSIARGSVSAGANIFYDSSTGEISAGPSTDSDEVKAIINNAYLADSGGINKAFIDGLGVDAATLGGHDSSYYRINIYDSAGNLLNV